MATAARIVLNPHRRSQPAELLATALRERVVGQSEAIERIVDTFQTLLAGLNSRQRPLANFLLLGPTGSGKTHVVETLAETLFHHTNALIKVDCAEFQHSHEIAKLVGSPPGYLGHRETHPVFTQEALEQHQTPELPLNIVLLDEIEKASDAVWQLLLGILDKGSLTLGDNRRVSFARSMIFLTSNLGAGEMQSLLRPGFGFAPAIPMARPASLHNKLDAAATAAARRKFSPEFFNRLDHVIVFHPLDHAQLEHVLDLELAAVQARLDESRAPGAPALALQCSPRARAKLLADGTDAAYGARPLKRALERLLVAPLASLLATGQVGGRAETLVADFDPHVPDALVFALATSQAVAARARPA